MEREQVEASITIEAAPDVVFAVRSGVSSEPGIGGGDSSSAFCNSCTLPRRRSRATADPSITAMPAES